MLTLLGENNDYEAPSTTDLAEWADTFRLTHPVLSDGDYGVTWGNGWLSGGLPAMTLLAPGGEVVFADEYTYDTADIEAVLPE